MDGLSDASYIGSTGTSVDETAFGKATLKNFGGEDYRAACTIIPSPSASTTRHRCRSTTARSEREVGAVQGQRCVIFN
ncbi:hypothetical protein JIN85_15345 [Luteolibacter pohnpeiensis]|uniref:Uncharacterized protein n=1 Tax=Luteolibacter pohnpeiensis TaxID=454153 RepID=A0A934VVQ1_9BACT|nr:hypothetical protein [Luteolibacter pohnpeiensis]